MTDFKSTQAELHKELRASSGNSFSSVPGEKYDSEKFSQVVTLCLLMDGFANRFGYQG